MEMTLTAGSTLGCNNNWLNTSGGNYGGGGNSVLIGGGTAGGSQFTPTIGYGHYYPWQSYYYYTMPSDARPIKLTLSEVDRLRKVAKADPKIKDILQKFTGQIEITVDFE